MWSYVVRSLVNGLSRTELLLKPAMGTDQSAAKWGIGALSLPPDFEGFLEIEFAMCEDCMLALDDFVFTRSSCQAGEIYMYVYCTTIITCTVLVLYVHGDDSWMVCCWTVDGWMNGWMDGWVDMRIAQ